MWFIYVALLVLFIFFLDDFLLDKRQYELSEKFNGPKRWPLIGNINLFINISPKGNNETKSIYTFFKIILSREYVNKITLSKD